MDAQDQTFICNLHLSRLPGVDRRVWLATIDGKFLVRSTYGVLRRLQGYVVDFEARDNCWMFVWSTVIALKVRNFLRRIIHGILPVLANFLRRGISVLNICPICCVTNETVEHALFYCLFSSHVWHEFSGFDLYLMPIILSGILFWSFMLEVWFPNDLQKKAAYICWMIAYN